MNKTKAVFYLIISLNLSGISCTHKMNSSLHINKNNVTSVTLPGRGAAGLQLLFRTEPDSVVAIKRLDTLSTANKNEMPGTGDSFPVVFEIQALNKGETVVTFYETQPWNPNFKEIVVRQIKVVVD